MDGKAMTWKEIAEGYIAADMIARTSSRRDEIDAAKSRKAFLAGLAETHPPAELQPLPEGARVYTPVTETDKNDGTWPRCYFSETGDTQFILRTPTSFGVPGDGESERSGARGLALMEIAKLLNAKLPPNQTHGPMMDAIRHTIATLQGELKAAREEVERKKEIIGNGQAANRELNSLNAQQGEIIAALKSKVERVTADYKASREALYEEMAENGQYETELARLRSAIRNALSYCYGEFSMTHVIRVLKSALAQPGEAKEGEKVYGSKPGYWCPICKSPCWPSTCERCFQRFDNLLPVLTSQPGDGEGRQEGELPKRDQSHMNNVPHFSDVRGLQMNAVGIWRNEIEHKGKTPAEAEAFVRAMHTAAAEFSARMNASPAPAAAGDGGEQLIADKPLKPALTTEEAAWILAVANYRAATRHPKDGCGGMTLAEWALYLERVNADRCDELATLTSERNQLRAELASLRAAQGAGE